ncbi:MAG: protein-export membrane protein SecF [Chloroflexi bacterium RBG_16_56_11]|nr:MAG: protein-export membrane protein SecF [Chloroflexi bacterium RBG_16_56_11]
MLDIIGKRFWFFLISGVFIVIAIVSLATFGLKPSIEFSSGSILSVRFENPVDYGEFQQEMASLGYSDAIIQKTGAEDYLIRTEELSEEAKASLEAALAARFGALSEAQFNSVSPMVASETARNAAIAVAIAMVGMLLYVTWAFRRMPSPFRWGACFTIALFHDILVTVGLFSLFGHLLGWEMNLMFITGILGIVGVSLDNTIVVFDRMRENQKLGMSRDFEMVVNRSQIETLGRSLNTSLTILITCIALLLFVGGTIQNFVIVLLIGLIAGTFDSVFVAPGLLVVWDKGEWERFLPWRRPSAQKA